MKIAFTSSTGRTIDQHFGMATSFHIWEIGPQEATHTGEMAALAVGEDEEDRIASRANAIADCAIVCTMRIGGPAAAKLVARKIHPMKTGEEVPVAEVIGKLQEVLRGTPPPWLRKAMDKGKAPALTDTERKEG